MPRTGSPLSSTFRRYPLSRGAVHLGLIAACLTLAFPTLWMLSTSLKPIEETMTTAPQWIPNHARLDNFGEAVAYIPFWTYTKNTLLACTLAALGTTLSSALVAFSFTRLRWPGRDLLFVLTVSTMMIPFPVVMVPLYSVFKALGWIGSLAPLWVPSFFGSAFNIFLLRQFFRRIPASIAEAMMLDGASELRIFWRAYVPLAKAPLVVVAFFQFIFTWNDFLAPLLFLTDQDTFTLSVGLQFYQGQLGGTEWHYLMAASLLTTLPLIVLFFLVQKGFLDGLGAMKDVEP